MSNNSCIFITNAPDNRQGSSLYVITSRGSIRVSGANKDERKATVFIRPYTISYLPYLRSGVFYNTPCIGLYPFEAESDFLPKEFKNEIGHTGNIINEIIDLKDFLSPDFSPSTWIGTEADGIDWQTAVKKVNEALSYALNQGYEKKDILIEIPAKDSLQFN